MLPEVARPLERALFETALPGEIDDLDADSRAAIADFVAAAASQRAPGVAIVHLEPASNDETAPGRRRMMLAMVGDDRPFLVSSASAAITAAGLDIERLLHPVVDVRRDADGRLQDVVGLASGAVAPGVSRESLIYVEIERTGARARAELVSALEHVIADVAVAVDDWPAMQAALRKAAAELTENPPPVAPHRAAEAVAFLEWLAADNFTLLGVRRYELSGDLDDPTMVPVSDTGLGLLRDPDYPVWTGERGPSDTPRALKALLATPEPLLITTAGAVVSVHRRVNGDLVSVKGFDRQGRVVSETRFLGLYTSAAISASPRQVPVLRRKVAEVIDRLGFGATGHSGRTLLHVIETFPRQELTEASTERLEVMALGLLSLLDRPRPKLFARADPFGRFMSVLVYVTRDSYTSALRESVGNMLADATGGTVSRFEIELRAEGLARVHYIVNVPDPARFDWVSEAELDRRLRQLVRGWEQDLQSALVAIAGPTRAARLTMTHGRAFSLSYRAQHTPAEAAADIVALSTLHEEAGRVVRMLPNTTDSQGQVRLKIYRLGKIISLSEAVPVLENFGLNVIEEFPFDLAGGALGRIHDFMLEVGDSAVLDDWDALRARVEPALTAVLTGTHENDLFNALIVAAGLEAEAANWLRAYFRYMRQTGVTYGVATVVDALRRYPAITRDLVRLFETRFRPDVADRAAAEIACLAEIETGLADVASIDDDRILRLYRSIILATLRTNAFVPGGPEALAFKLDSHCVPNLPPPVPYREIWVYSPRIEGIHLRGGPIARGGLRWSDRRDDFRTEVLGLVKAQKVKNTVIVPTGAKGGFYPKLLPAPANRDAWLAEGTQAYRIFIRALLSLTDNLAPDGTNIPPADVVCHDAPDPYLVVAADKGTATFSDTANGIAKAHGFWLGDAFASGGGNGYDHKAMAITARGAWISVQRHFREMGVDVQTQPIRVAGVGDMSGDVFGNGMLLSPVIKLVAAFDHRHFFFDPEPDVAAAFAERQRMFALPRSSWDDYDRSKISPGGGVFARSLKSVPLTPAIKTMLGVATDSLSPSDLIAAILKMPSDLLWFGGIGTYVKAANESNADAGDRANDAHRINGADIGARVVGEGANLGVTQAGRIEFAAQGGRINTDFIDNSAGVDCSDNEVNIKIALNGEVLAGRLAEADRDALLVEMTDDVAGLVLVDNILQTQALSLAERDGAAAVPGHVRLIQTLEASAAELDRKVEGLPADDLLIQRGRAGHGLERPELAVVMAYAKMAIYDALTESRAHPLIDDALLVADLHAAFPTAMRNRFAGAIDRHRLRRELIATKLTNEIVNRGGLALAFELAEELGVGLVDVASAFVAARDLFDFRALWAAIDAAPVAGSVHLDLHLAGIDVLRTQMADLIRCAPGENPAQLTARLKPGVGRLGAEIDGLLRPEPRAQLDRFAARLLALGAPADIAAALVRIDALDGAVGVALLASDTGASEAATAGAYTALGEATGLDWAKGAATALAPTDPWERLLKAGLVRDFEALRLELLRRIAPAGTDPAAAVVAWLQDNGERLSRIAGPVARARAGGDVTTAMLAHLAGQARAVLV
ncbi:NAD-glutamate dehydrogenase [Polymorphobacter fuscus]|uniref:NAD-glutamate dehydrogenase n=1 Tax=Sandarakinorhabdus fusca TaxID=1439888 RepID=A0A7C9KNT5_9SPHN|nr:NAD-glutamate dehydrogenase [Polymorphobacter fuscus]MQT17984.1 NAD-glutamate dehydrogenase [Polymorphobacter fuscus]